ncbi:serine hydrolase domain-containing protein [Cellulomonas hominis]
MPVRPLDQLTAISAEITATLHDLVAASAVPGLGVAVVENGLAVHTGGSGVADARTGWSVQASTMFHACSVSKLVTAVGVLRLVELGQLDLTSDVDTFLTSWRLPRVLPEPPADEEAAGPSAPGAAVVGEAGPDATAPEPAPPPRVTIAHLLAHVAGIDDADGSFGVTTGPTPPMLDLLEGRTAGHAGPVRVVRAPGSEFAYSDAGYCVLQQVVEDVTGEPFADAMDRLVLDPLGLGSTLFWDRPDGAPDAEQVDTGRLEGTVLSEAAAGHGPAGHAVPGGRAFYPYLAAAGLWSTPVELARLLADLVASWNGSVSGLLRPSTVRTMWTGPAGAAFAGLGVFLLRAGGELVVQSHGWGEGFQSVVRAYPRRQAVVAVMINADPGVPQDESLVGQAVDAVAAAYGWPVD